MNVEATGFFVISLKNDTAGRFDLFRFFHNFETFNTFRKYVRAASV